MSAPRPDWRDTLRVGTDVALMGILITVAALPVVTAGAAVVTGSVAMHHLQEYDRWPSLRDSWSVFRRALLPGLAALVACAAVAILLAIDLAALRNGVVPGGTPVIVVTLLLAATAAGYAALVVVALGLRGGGGWLSAAREAASSATARPAALPAAAGILALAGLLAALVHPALVPALVGYALFALHSAARCQQRIPTPAR